MDFKFPRSLVIISQLAQKASLPPPSEDQPPWEYVDRTFTVLGQTLNSFDERMRQEFLAQQELIISQFFKFEAKIKTEIDRRFEKVEDKINGCFEEIEGTLQELKTDLQDLKTDLREMKVRQENILAIDHNSRLSRFHQPIKPIHVFRYSSQLDKFVWMTSPKMPKHLKDIYQLGQHAKGIFELGWKGEPGEQGINSAIYYYKYFTNVYFIKAKTMNDALNIIQGLADFFDSTIHTDNASENESTVVLVQNSVDEHMDELLAKWGIDWEDVLERGKKHEKNQLQQAGVKRAGEGSSKRGKKKSRG